MKKLLTTSAFLLAAGSMVGAAQLPTIEELGGTWKQVQANVCEPKEGVQLSFQVFIQDQIVTSIRQTVIFYSKNGRTVAQTHISQMRERNSKISVLVLSDDEVVTFDAMRQGTEAQVALNRALGVTQGEIESCN